MRGEDWRAIWLGSAIAVVSALLLTVLAAALESTVNGPGRRTVAEPVLWAIGSGVGLTLGAVVASWITRRALAGALAALIGAIAVLALVVVAGVVWNTAFGPVASLFQSATVKTNAISPELSGAWINMTANLGIGGGALLGGVVLDATDVGTLAWVSAVPLALGLLMAAVSRRAFTATPSQDRPARALMPAVSDP